MLPQMHPSNQALQRLALPFAAALAALLIATGFANAQEPPETQTATRLEPGVNLVGWVGEPASVSQLFREIPQLESIWAWDAELDDWVVAGRGAPEGLGWLWRVSPGMGLRLALGGEEPFLWQRPTEPPSGLVKLRTGWNLVAWSGADSAPLEQVAKGIGWSLRELRRWDAANQQWTTWTSPERSTQLIAISATDQATTDEETEPVTVRRGEALWVNTARSVNWLQPTDILPRLVFPGGASDELQARVREDLESVLAFYGQQYGIQANPNFSVYIPKDVEALIQAQKADGDEIDDAEAASLRARWNRVGAWAWAGSDGRIVVKQAKWPEDLSTSEIARARYTLTHEYFHILQRHLSDASASQWLVEGTANWVEGAHQVLDGEADIGELRERELSELSPRTPTLRSAEQDNARWEYTLGWLATDRLTTAAGDGSYIEFWRRLAPTEIGPHGRWASRPDWHTAFQETFGLPVSSFYADFDAWQREQAAANGAGASPDDDTRWIRGRVIGEDGASGRGVLVNAIRVEGETSVGWQQRAEADNSGAFAVRVPEDGDYRVSVDINEDCTRYYSNGKLIEEQDEAQPVTVVGSDVQGVNIRLSSVSCRQIRGQVVNTVGEPLAGVSITICETTTHTCTWDKRTKLDGTFAISAPTAGEYRLRLALTDHCEVYFQDRGVGLSSSDASLITVAGADVDGLTLRVPDNVCAYQYQKIRGSVTKADGQPLTDTYITACREVNERCVIEFGESIDADGTFAITVPADGRYRVSFRLKGCTIYFRAGGFTTSRAERGTVRVSGRDVRLGSRQIPQDMCALRRISGSITAADGQPLVDAYISACHESKHGPCAGYHTESDGSFSIAVPREGRYSLSFNLDGCAIHFRARGFTTSREERGTARVEGRDVQLNPRQIPQGMCAMGRISGNVATADGQPFAGAYISACREVDSGPCAGGRTGSDGSFSIEVPEAGAYRLWFSLGGCSSLIYFSARGFTTEREDRLVTRVADRELRLDARRIPADLCPRILGRVTKMNSQPLSGAYVEACREVDGVCVESTRGRIGYDGSFAIAVSAAGSYRLGYNLGGCELYYSSTGLTGNAAEAMRFDAGDRDLRIGYRLVLDTLCAYQISGVVVGADGAPLTEAQVAACEYVDGECVSDVVYGRVDDNGRFAMTVPVDGAYRLILELSHCSVYFGQEDLASNRSEAWLFQVGGQDVRLSQRQAPTEPCSLQANSQQISGQIAKSDGQPLANTRISACREVDGVCVAWFGGITDAAGAFAITVPDEGAYSLRSDLDGCPILFHAAGFTTDWDQRPLVRVSGRALQINPLQIPAEMCAHRISGRFVDANGAPLANKFMRVCGTSACPGVRTAADGRFTIRVPSDGSYTISIFLLTDACGYRLKGQALGSPDNPVRVSGADVAGITLRLPGTVEELCG